MKELTEALRGLVTEWRAYPKIDQYTLGLEEAGDKLEALLATQSADGGTPAPEADGGDPVGSGSALDLALREYEREAIKHGKTGWNAIAVDAAGARLRALYAASAPPPAVPLGYIWPGVIDELRSGYVHGVTIWARPTGQAGLPVYTTPPPAKERSDD